MSDTAKPKRRFHLKPFSLSHDLSTMKVGTDSLILGAWTNVENAQNILDIGTGCGILALMLASKCDVNIIAIELDKDSSEEAKANFISSPFYRRLKVMNIDFNDFIWQEKTKFDLIISNPPFFINDRRSLSLKKSQARHGDTLSYQQLIIGAEKIISKTGRFCLVLPYPESQEFIRMANEISGFRLQKQLTIFPRRGESPNRINLQFGLENKGDVVIDKLVIREEDGVFSEQYKNQQGNFLIAQ